MDYDHSPCQNCRVWGIPSHFQTHANIIWLSYGWLHSYIALDQIPLIPISGGLRFEQTDAAPALNRNI